MFYAKLKNKLKSRLVRLVKSACGMNAQYDYLSSIAIKNNNPVFQSIGPVNNHLNGEVHSNIVSVFPEINIKQMISRDAYNLPATCDRELYHGDRHYDWWLSGLFDYLKIKQIMGKYGSPLKAGDTFYEMGCASGRVLRHFAVQHDDLNVWGSDINNRHIEWMRLNLPENINIFSEYYSSSVTAGVEQCRYSLCIFCFYTY